MFWQALHWNNDLSPGLSKHLSLPFHNEATVIYSLPLFCVYDCSVSINQNSSGRKSWSRLYWFLTNFQTTFKDVNSATELKLHFCKSRLISLHPMGLCWSYWQHTMTNSFLFASRETDSQEQRETQTCRGASYRCSTLQPKGGCCSRQAPSCFKIFHVSSAWYK